MAIPLHILLLEDDALDAELNVAVLAGAGYACRWERVQTREEFLACLHEDYDLILADYNLPQFDGISALTLMRAQEIDIPFVLVSGALGEEVAIESLKAGATDYVLKQRLTRLVPVVHRALREREERRQRQRAENALLTSEKRFRSLIENSMDAVALLAAEGTILYVSPANHRIVGRTNEDAVGHNVFEFIHPDDAPCIADLLSGLVQQPGTAVTAEFRYQHKNGSWRWVEAVSQNLLADPSIEALVVNYRDITARRQDEETLKESEARYRSLFNNALEGIFRSTPSGHFTHVNPALVRMLGYDSTAEVLALRLPDDLYRDPTQRTRLQAAYNPLGTVDGVELLWKKKNGESLIVTLYAKAIHNAQGSIVAYEGMVLDITERKRAAEELQQEAQVSAALARVGCELIGSLDTTSLLDRLCQLITEVVACDCSHALLWKPQERKYRIVASHGHPPEQQERMQELKVSAETLRPLLAQFANEEIAILDVAAMKDLPLGVLARQCGLNHVLYVALRRGTELIGLQTAGYRVHQEPFTTRQIRILQGVGQLASLALEDARLLEELRQANRLKSDFLATMSHELRTPLNIIMGYADLLLEEEFGVLTPEQRRPVQRIRKATEGELELITTLLDVSRLEAGRLPVDEQGVRVEELLNELAVEVEELLREKPRVTSMWQVDPGLPMLYTDRAKLKVVLQNLLGNAIKFTEEGSVTVTASVRDGGVEIAVSDTGIGIAPEVQAVMFGMFRQGDSSPTRRYAGVGLGLYITLQLLTLLGGTIAVESEVSRGTTFRVWLPAAEGIQRQEEWEERS